MTDKEKDSICEKCANNRCMFKSEVHREKCGFFIDEKSLIEEFRKAMMNQPLMVIKDDYDWIPCAERMPKMLEDVLVSLDSGQVTVGYRDSEKYWHIHIGGFMIENEEVLAWMPLPEPYKGAEPNG